MSTLTNTLSSLPPALLTAATTAYLTPPRAYHHFGHVREVLRVADLVPTWNHPLEVTLAILFHDAVYLPGRSDNEAASADLADRLLATHTPTADRALV